MNMHSSAAKRGLRWRAPRCHAAGQRQPAHPYRGWSSDKEACWVKGYLNFPSGRSHLLLHFCCWKTVALFPSPLPLIPATVTRRPCPLTHPQTPCPATRCVPAWKASSLWGRQIGWTSSPAEERMHN